MSILRSDSNQFAGTISSRLESPPGRSRLRSTKHPATLALDNCWVQSGWKVLVELGQLLKTNLMLITINQPDQIGEQSTTIKHAARVAVPTEAELKRYAVYWSAE